MSNRVVISSNRPHGENDEEGMYVHSSDPMYTREMLVEMTDYDLRTTVRDLSRRINRLRTFGEDEARIRCEVELCYVQDEVFRRSEAIRLAEEYSKRTGVTHDPNREE